MFTKLLKERNEHAKVGIGSVAIQEAAYSHPLVTDLERLQAAKQHAIENEDYEEASELKHRIQSLEHQMHDCKTSKSAEEQAGCGVPSASVPQKTRRGGAWAAFVEQRGGAVEAICTESTRIPLRNNGDIAKERPLNVNTSDRLQEPGSLNVEEHPIHHVDQSISTTGYYALQSDGSWDIKFDDTRGSYSKNSELGTTLPSHHHSNLGFRSEPNYCRSMVTNLDDEINACATSSDSDGAESKQSVPVILKGEHDSRYTCSMVSEDTTPHDDLSESQREKQPSDEKAGLLARLRRRVLSIAERDFSTALEQVTDAFEAALNEDLHVACMLLRLRIELQRNNGNFDEALADCDQWVELAPESAEARFRRAIARLQMGGNDAGALGDLRRAESLGIRKQHDRQFQRLIRRAKHWLSLPSRPNHYYALGVPFESSHETLKRAYRCSLLRWHPDKPCGDAARFRSVQEAWDILGDQEQRNAYDFGPASRVADTRGCGVDVQHYARAAYPFKAEDFNECKMRPKGATKRSSWPQ